MTWLVARKSTSDIELDVDVYELEDQDFASKIPLTDGDYEDYLLIRYRGPDKLWVEFAVFEFCSTHSGKNQYTMIFHGEGPAGNLRECRHIWWGENGYTFMLNFKVVEQAFTILKNWFD